jgi:hypothetical protein
LCANIGAILPSTANFVDVFLADIIESGEVLDLSEIAEPAPSH